jgi:predicted nucleic acid-binding protein
MASRSLFVDTWGWLVLANDRDPCFKSVSRLREAADARWITTDYVLDETMTRLFGTAPFAAAKRYLEGIFKAAQAGTLDIEHVTPERFRAAWRLRLLYQDKPRISFTDLTSVAVMRELGIELVLTGDAHFEHVNMGFRRIPGPPA